MLMSSVTSPILQLVQMSLIQCEVETDVYNKSKKFNKLIGNNVRNLKQCTTVSSQKAD